MANDDYQYQPRPLPVFATIGIESLSAAQVSPTHVGGPNVDTPFLDSPFSNPDFTGGGGGGMPEPDCSTSWSIGTVNTSQLNLPCSSPVSSLTSGLLSLASGGSNSISVNASDGVIQINTADGNIQLSLVNDSITISNTSSRSATIDLQDLTDDGNSASFHELDVPHMGALGKRVFFSSQAYAA